MPSKQKNLIDAAWEQVRETRPIGCGSDTSDGGPPPHGTFPGYRLVGEVHRGGQGVVYEGVQESTGRTVAIKVLRDGLFAGPKERMRFEREVQILAQLKHPNIVTIHDSGSAGGANYFVMDFIPGLALDDFARRGALAIRDRLALFSKICAAVNVAHLRGVIHRDLKPGNIRIDPSGEPHILDFGLAKLSDWDPHHGDEVTVTGQFVGSAPWASPEQAQGRSQDIDLRTDVYALGVMLFQLMTGGFPYEVTGGLSEVARNILETEPPNPRSLNRHLDDEIATIILTALRKAPDQRYQTAGTLGADIDRYLRGDAIAAKRDSAIYVLRKQLARHRWAVAIASSFLLVVLIGLTVSASFWYQAVLARDAEAHLRILAQRNEALARTHAAAKAEAAERAEAVSEFLTDMLRAASPLVGGTPDLTVSEVLDRTGRSLASGQLSDQPPLKAAIQRVLGMTYGSLGEYEVSRDYLVAACAGLAALRTDPDETVLDCRVELAEAHRHLGDLDEADAILLGSIALIERNKLAPSLSGKCLFARAEILRDRGMNDEAIRVGREALELIRSQPVNGDRDVASAMNDLALALVRQDQVDEAIALQQDAVRMYRDHLGDSHYSTAVANANLAGMYAKRGQYETAIGLARDGLASMRATVGDDHPSIAAVLDTLGRLLVKHRQFNEAEAVLSEALQRRRTLFDADHALVAVSLNNYAMVQFELGQFADSERHFREALKIYAAARGVDHPGLDAIRNNIAAIQRLRGATSRAEATFRKILETRRVTMPQHPSTSESLHNLGITLAASGQLPEAQSLLAEALEMRRSHSPGSMSVASTLSALATVRLRQGDPIAAERHAGEAISIWREALGPGHPTTSAGVTTQGRIHLEAGRHEQAIESFNQALGTCEGHLGTRHWQTAVNRGWLGSALLAAEQVQEAESHLVRSHGQLMAQLGPDSHEVIRVAEVLAELCEAHGRAQDARRWRERAGTAAPQP
jgi:tetratricopeptide (TPR) repeat protein